MVDHSGRFPLEVTENIQKLKMVADNNEKLFIGKLTDVYQWCKAETEDDDLAGQQPRACSSLIDSPWYKLYAAGHTTLLVLKDN